MPASMAGCGIDRCRVIDVVQVCLANAGQLVPEAIVPRVSLVRQAHWGEAEVVLDYAMGRHGGVAVPHFLRDGAHEQCRWGSIDYDGYYR